MVLAALSLTGMAAGASGAETSVPRGTVGLVAVPFEARNRGPGTVVCSATLAHWYSVELGHAAPDAVVAARLWSDPATGSIFLLNTLGDRMPVETLWCGLAGKAWDTRALVPLERRAGVVPPPIRLACEGTARLACRTP